MKKNTNLLFHIFADVLSFTLIVGGLIMLIASIFIPTIPVFQATMLFITGFILQGISSLYINFIRMINLISDFLEQTNKKIPETTKFDKIVITDDTSIEDIEIFKKQFPELKDTLDEISNSIKDNSIYDKKINFEKLRTSDEIIKQSLEFQLKEALENQDFERACQIRDELKERNL